MINVRCKVHGVPLVCFCPACRGSAHSERKARASRQNGRKGGRPKMRAKLRSDGWMLAKRKRRGKEGNDESLQASQMQ